MVYNNTEVRSGMFFNYRSKCEFCDREHNDHCELQFPQDCKTLKDFIKKANGRNLILVVQWRSIAKAHLELIERPEVKKVFEDPSQMLRSGDARISLYDCLNSFMNEETLSGDDMWYCNKCKEFVVATKKMEVYKTPEILIVHFKRFSHNRMSMFGSRKINDEIDFPVEGLNMTNYIL